MNFGLTEALIVAFGPAVDQLNKNFEDVKEGLEALLTEQKLTNRLLQRLVDSQAPAKPVQAPRAPKAGPPR